MEYQELFLILINILNTNNNKKISLKMLTILSKFKNTLKHIE